MPITLTITIQADNTVLRTEHSTLIEARRALSAWAGRHHCSRTGNGSEGVLSTVSRALATYTIGAGQ